MHVFIAACLVASLLVAPHAHADATASLSGTVSFVDHSPFPGVHIELDDPVSGVLVADTTSVATGDYSVTVPPGTYDLVFTPPASTGYQPTRVPSFDLSTDRIYGLSYDNSTPVTYHTISGTLRFEDGSPLTHDSGDIDLYAQQPGGGHSSGATINPDGTYSMTVVAGRYTQLWLIADNLGANPLGGGYSLTDPAADLDASSGDVSFDPVIHRTAVRVHVLGADGAPDPNATVTMEYQTIDPGDGFPYATGTVPLATADPTAQFTWRGYGPRAGTDTTGTATLYGFTGITYTQVCGAGICVPLPSHGLTSNIDITLRRVVKSISVTAGPLTPQRLSSRSAASSATTASPVSIKVGGSRPMVATGVYADGSSVNVSRVSTWSSSDANVATVDSSGIVTGVSAGTATISANLGAVRGSIVVSVVKPRVVSLRISPVSPTVVNGRAIQLSAKAIYSDGSSAVVTGQTTWASNTASVASVSTTGRATGRSEGTAVMTGTFEGVSGQATLTVTKAVLVSISLSTRKATLASGRTLQLTASGRYSDGSLQPLSTGVVWVSDNASVSVDSTGLVTARAPGSAVVSATFNGYTSSATIAVTPAVVVTLSLTPTNFGLRKGATNQLQATATYSDGSTNVLSSGLTWTSSVATVASVTAAGLVKGRSAGTASITARIGTVRGTAQVTVTG